MKICIPRIEKWNAIKLKENNLKEFNNFIKNNGYDLHYFSVDNKIKNIVFKWNPMGYDYADSVKIEVGQIFMYHEEEPTIYQIISNIKEDWLIINED